MVDFTMCSNQECLLGDYCERQTAQRSRRQSFAYFSPNPGAETCDHLIPNEKRKAWYILSGQNDRVIHWEQKKIYLNSVYGRFAADPFGTGV